MFNIHEKYEYLVEQYHAPLYRLIYGYVGNREEAEDVVQTAYLKLWECEKHFISEAHAKNWLYKVAVNRSLDVKKSRWSNVVLVEKYDDIPFETDESYELFEKISAMKDEYRIVILLYYYEEYSIKEISRILDVNPSTVATRLSRARKELKESLNQSGGQLWEKII